MIPKASYFTIDVQAHSSGSEPRKEHFSELVVKFEVPIPNIIGEVVVVERRLRIKDGPVLLRCFGLQWTGNSLPIVAAP
jgi:hypothetical protein